MYGHEQHLSISPSPTQLQESQTLIDESDVVQGVEESIDDHYHHHNQQRCSDDGSVAFEGDSIYAVDNFGRIEGSDQLTISFRGQVYVFDSVTPDKLRLTSMKRIEAKLRCTRNPITLVCLAFLYAGLVKGGKRLVNVISDLDELASGYNDLAVHMLVTVHKPNRYIRQFVEAVLLVLGGNVGGSAPPLALPGAEAPQVAHGSQQDMTVFPGRSSQPQREASLNRFRQKRKERRFDKLIRYNVRQEVAMRMHRSKGQFTSTKKGDESSGCNAQDSGSDETQLETSCTHCGISSKSTPMMRRGPNGPRTLCNACGLVWANKGTLRDLKKQDQYVMPNEMTGASPFRATDILGEAKYVNFGENDSPALVVQH